MKRFVVCMAAVLLCAPLAHAKPPRKAPRVHVFGSLSGGHLGAEVVTMSEELRDFFGAPKDAGILVNRVEKDSPGDKAGLRAGDVIVEVEGSRIDQPWDVGQALAAKKPGDTARVEIVRKGQRQTLTVTVKDSPNGFAMLGHPDVKVFTDRNFGAGFDFDVPGVRSFSFGADEDKLDKLLEKLDKLDKRLERLEKK